MSNNTFTPGQKVIAKYVSGYHFTEGKEYTVIEYCPSEVSALPNFTWPAYLLIEDDNGKPSMCHAYRFKPKD